MPENIALEVRGTDQPDHPSGGEENMCSSCQDAHKIIAPPKPIEIVKIKPGDHITMEHTFFSKICEGDETNPHTHHAIVKEVGEINERKDKAIVTLYHAYQTEDHCGISVREEEKVIDINADNIKKVSYQNGLDGVKVCNNAKDNLNCRFWNNCEHFCHYCSLKENRVKINRIRALCGGLYCIPMIIMYSIIIHLYGFSTQKTEAFVIFFLCFIVLYIIIIVCIYFICCGWIVAVACMIWQIIGCIILSVLIYYNQCKVTIIVIIFIVDIITIILSICIPGLCQSAITRAINGAACADLSAQSAITGAINGAAGADLSAQSAITGAMNGEAGSDLSAQSAITGDINGAAGADLSAQSAITGAINGAAGADLSTQSAITGAINGAPGADLSAQSDINGAINGAA